MLENFKKQLATRHSIPTEIVSVIKEGFLNNVVKHFSNLKTTVF